MLLLSFVQFICTQSQTTEEEDITAIIFSETIGDDVSLYYQINDEVMESFTSNIGITVTPPCTISFYFTTDFCTEYQEITTKKTFIKEVGSSPLIYITYDDIPYKCLHDKKTYYVNIKNGLSDVFDTKIFVKTRSDQIKEIPIGSIYKDQLIDYEPFVVDIYIETSYCSRRKFATTTATDENEIATIENSHIPTECIPYLACININLPYNYIVSYKSSSESDNVMKPITNNQLFLESTNEFNVNLYLSGTSSCSDNYLWKTFLAEKVLECITLTTNDIPTDCLPKYTLCFDVSGLEESIILGYTVDNEDESQMKLLTTTQFSNLFSFSINLYMIKSYACTEAEKIRTFRASLNAKCISITNEMMPAKCMKKYYVRIIDKSSSSYTFYYKKDENYFDFITHVFEISFVSQIDLEIYVSSQACETYEFVKIIHATTNPEEFTVLTDNDVPQKCIKYGICYDLTQLSNDYQFTYTISYEDNKVIHSLDHSIVTYTSSEPFSIHYKLVKSPYCNENEIFGEIVATDPFYCFTYKDNNIPVECKYDIEKTPNPTKIPIQPNIYESVETFLDMNSGLYNSLNEGLESKFLELNQDISNKNKMKSVHIIADSIIFDYPLKEDELISLIGNGNIIYKGGNLQIASIRANVVLNEENNINVGFYHFNEEYYSYLNIDLAESYKNEPEITVKIHFLSDIASELKISVPDNVKTVEIDSVELNGYSDIKVVNNEQYIHTEINTINIKNNNIRAYLKNVTITDSITFEQGSKCIFSDVDFKEGAIIKYNLYNFNNYVWNGVINVDRNIGIPESIEICNINENITPNPYWEYDLIIGNIDLATCKKLAEKINLTNIPFNKIVCEEKSFSSLTSDEYKNTILYLKYEVDEPRKNTGLIIGIVVAVVVVIVVVIVIVIIVVVIRKRRKTNSEKEGNDDKDNNNNDINPNENVRFEKLSI